MVSDVIPVRGPPATIPGRAGTTRRPVRGPGPGVKHDLQRTDTAGLYRLDLFGQLAPDLLEGHLAVQLAVQRHEDGPQAAAGMRPEDAEPLALGGGRADRVGGGAIGIILLPG